jgi:NAD(P) transhydrogenase subunit beta
MTDMPQMVAIYNGMGGGAAAAIAAIEFARGEPHGTVTSTLAVLGALIGAVAFSGSCVAFAKLQGLMKKAFRLPAQNNGQHVVLARSPIGCSASPWSHRRRPGRMIFLFFVLALALGVILVTCPSAAPTCRW